DELCNRQQILNSFCQIHQLETPTFTFDSRVAADERSEPCRIDVGHLGEIQKDATLPVAKQVLDPLFNLQIAFTKHNLASQIEDADSSNNTLLDVHAASSGGYSGSSK